MAKTYHPRNNPRGPIHGSSSEGDFRHPMNRQGMTTPANRKGKAFGVEGKLRHDRHEGAANDGDWDD